jgi:Uri superfamily endonuclease
LPPQAGAHNPPDGPFPHPPSWGGPWVGPERTDALPAGPGAYLLAIRLDRPAPLPPRLVRPGLETLPAGWLVYAGSARGPGGLRARLGRHLRPDKARRWHVDWLTAAPGATVRAWPVPDGRECALVAAVLAWPGASVPVPGFGSSDCPRCPAHLLALAVPAP